MFAQKVLTLSILCLAASIGLSKGRSAGDGSSRSGSSSKFCNRHRLSSLRQLIVVAHRGHHSPVMTFPTDVHRERSWRLGFGQLTPKGYERMYQVGKWTRQCYAPALRKILSPKRVYARSTDNDCTMMSTQAYLTGSYPSIADYLRPKKTRGGCLKSMYGCLWQPFNIATASGSYDAVLLGHEKCPRYSEIICNIEQSHKATTIIKKDVKFFKMVAHKAGLVNKTCGYWTALDIVANSLFAQLDEHKTPVSWLDDRHVIKKMARYRNKAVELLTGNEELVKIVTSALNKEIVDRLEAKAGGMSSFEHVVYVTESTPMEAMLARLGAFKKVSYARPPYGAVILIELHELKGVHYVQVYYRYSVYEDPILLKLPGSKNCKKQTGKQGVYTLSDFKGLLQSPSYKPSEMTTTLATTTANTESERSLVIEDSAGSERTSSRQQMCKAKVAGKLCYKWPSFDDDSSTSSAQRSSSKEKSQKHRKRRNQSKKNKKREVSSERSGRRRSSGEHSRSAVEVKEVRRTVKPERKHRKNRKRCDDGSKKRRFGHRRSDSSSSSDSRLERRRFPRHGDRYYKRLWQRWPRRRHDVSRYSSDRESSDERSNYKRKRRPSGRSFLALIKSETVGKLRKVQQDQSWANRLDNKAVAKDEAGEK